MSTLEMVVTILVAIISSGVFNRILDSIFERNNGVKKAARLLMKNQLRSLCLQYIQQKWIYEDELDDIIAMHSCYHNDLKGNGFLDSLMDRVKQLEVRGIGAK